MIELSDLVAPRASVFQGAERVLITDAIESIQSTATRHSVLLDGVACEFALVYLQNFYRDDPRIHVAPSFFWDDADDSCCVSIHTDKTIPSSCTLWVAPWDRDDVIQYMLATNARECCSIITRIQPEFFALVQGGFSLWRCIIDTMLRFPMETDFHQILKKLLRVKLPSTVPLWGGEPMKWLADQLLASQSFDKLQLLSDDPVYRSLLGISSLRLEIEADRFADLLKHSNKSILQRLHSNQRLIEVSKRLRGNTAVADFLKGCIFEKYASTSASILSQIDTAWKPVKRSHYQFENAYLCDACWSGSYLEQANFGGANLTHICLDHSVLTDSIFHVTKCDGASFVDTCLRGVKANKASFVSADFCRAEMCQTVWKESSFSGANFSESLLDESSFNQCDLRDANFRSCVANLLQLSHCKIAGADFSDAQLGRSHFEGLDLKETILCRTNLNKSNLFRSCLESMTIVGCNFYCANLAEAYLSSSRMRETSLLRSSLANSRLGEIDWEGCDLREANLSGATFHYGSTRCGIVDSPYPSHGTRTGFYTDDWEELVFKTPELVRKASLVGCDLRGANLHGVDFYLVDLRGAILDPSQLRLVSASGAILD